MIMSRLIKIWINKWNNKQIYYVLAFSLINSSIILYMPEYKETIFLDKLKDELYIKWKKREINF